MMKKLICMVMAVMLALSAVSAFAAYVIPDKETFSDGLILVRDQESKKYGYMDTTGATVIAPQYAIAEGFSNGTAVVSLKNPPETMLINTRGEVMLEAPSAGKNQHYEFKTGLINGFSTAVLWEMKEVKKGTKKETVLQHQGYVLVDEAGKIITPEPLMYVAPFNENGLALVGQGELPKEGSTLTNTGNTNYIATWDGNTPILAAKQFYFINADGKKVGDTYDSCHEFKNGFAAVKKEQVNGAMDWGFIDADGNEVVPPKYELALDFSEGRAAVAENGKYGFIDESGNIVVEPKYDAVRSFSDGLAVVATGEDDDKRYGYITTDGNEVIEPVYAGAGDFLDGFAAAKDVLTWGIIDKDGNWVISPLYESIQLYTDLSILAVKQPSMAMIVNENGEFINIVTNDKAYEDGAQVSKVEFPVGDTTMLNFVDADGAFTCINSFKTDVQGETFYVKQGSGLWGLIDIHGNEIAPAIYQSISRSNDGVNPIFLVKKDDRFGYMRQDGALLTDIVYDKAAVFNGVGLAWQGDAWFIINPDGSPVDFAARMNAMKEYTDKETIKAVQQALNDAGYDCGTPDGVAGKNTQNAIGSYQKDKGLTVTGTATYETLVSLGIME